MYTYIKVKVLLMNLRTKQLYNWNVVELVSLLNVKVKVFMLRFENIDIKYILELQMVECSRKSFNIQNSKERSCVYLKICIRIISWLFTFLGNGPILQLQPATIDHNLNLCTRYPLRLVCLRCHGTEKLIRIQRTFDILLLGYKISIFQGE